MTRRASAGVKPNQYPRPGPIGNTTGVISPQTSPSSVAAKQPEPQPETKSWWGRVSGAVHLGLDIVGMIPVIGELADGANALIYVAEGDYANAALSAAAMLPIGGQAATAAKFAKQGAEIAAKAAARGTAEAAAKVSRQVPDAARAAASKKPSAKTGGNIKGGKKGQGKADKQKGDCVSAQVKKSAPVNAVYGCKVLSGEEDLDFVIASPLPLIWQRTYISNNSQTDCLGQGWTTPLTLHLECLDDEIVYVDEEGRRISFPSLAVGESFYSKYEGITLHRHLNHEYELVTEDGLRFVFARKYDVFEHTFAINQRQYSPQSTTRTEYPEADNKLSLLGFFDSNKNCWAVRYGEHGLAEQLLSSSAIALDFEYLTISTGEFRLQNIYRRQSHSAPQLLVSYEYSTEGDLIRVLDDTKSECRSFKWQNHIMVQHSRPQGITAYYEWDELGPDGQVVKSYLSTGQQWVLKYLPNRTCVTDVDGNTSWFLFDDEKRLTGLLDPLQGSIKFELDTYGNVQRQIDQLGCATHYQYDLQGNVTKVTQADGSFFALTWDAQWREPLSMTDELGNETRYEYDEYGRLIAIFHANGTSTRLQRNKEGLPVKIIDAHDKVKHLEYNQHGLLTRYVDCSGHATTYQYDNWDNVVQVEDALQNITLFSYQRINRQSCLTLVKYPDGTQERFAYDAQGRVIGHQDALQQVTRYQLDQRGLPQSQENAQGYKLQYKYDVQGRLVELHNENQARYFFSWDALDRLISEQGFDGRRMDYRYDAAGRLVEAVDGVPQGAEYLALNHQEVMRTRYQRDVLGRLLGKYSTKPRTGSASKPIIEHERFQYDALGQLITARNAHARVVMQYDVMGQLIDEQVYHRGRGLTRLKHEYDDLGFRQRTEYPGGRKLTIMRYGSGHVHQINLDKQVISEIERDGRYQEVSRTQGALQTRYQWDSLGRLLHSIAEHKEHHQHTNALVGEPRSQGQHIARRYQYDAVGQVQAIDDLRKGSTHYQYDELGRLLGAQHPFLKEAFAFDPAHNLMSEQQATEQKKRSKSTRWSEEEWDAYVQANAHRADFDPWLTPAQVENDPRYWGASRPNRLTTWQDHRYQYDVWGNCIQKISGSQNSQCKQSYEWDAGHQLSKTFIERFNDGQWHTEGWGYDYDPFGRRLAKYPLQLETEQTATGQHKVSVNSRPWKSPKATYYCWDGHQLAIEQTGQAQQLYIYEPESFVPLALIKSEGQLSHVSELEHALQEYPLEWQQLQHQYPEHWAQVLEQQRKYRKKAGVTELKPKAKTPENQQVYYYHTDHLGTPQELTDQDGDIVWSAHYHAWGRVHSIERPQKLTYSQHGNTVTESWVAAEQIEQPLRFQGQYHDSETGLHYNRYRYYDPDIGRFISQDPIGLLGGINLYQYAPNPVGWVDPFGLCPDKIDPRARGRESEERVLEDLGIPKNTEKVYGTEGASIPDGLTKNQSVEIKDTKVVSRTKQIRIQAEAAKKAGRETVLITGTNTKVSKPAKEVFTEIIRRDDLGPKK